MPPQECGYHASAKGRLDFLVSAHQGYLGADNEHGPRSQNCCALFRILATGLNSIEPAKHEDIISPATLQEGLCD
jgi:hypothetical protein